MTFEVEVAGRLRTVSVERTDAAGRYRVTIDGTAHVVDAVRVGEYGLSLLLSAGDSGDIGVRTGFDPGLTPSAEMRRSSEVDVAPGASAGEWLVTLDGRIATVALNGRRRGHAADAGAHGHGDAPVIAPMPGRVVRVLAAAGDEVAARQGIVVVEAMKMENELRAPKAGRVREVTVTPGTSVEAGRILAVIE
jgi:biotin carboxyl carrier protein